MRMMTTIIIVLYPWLSFYITVVNNNVGLPLPVLYPVTIWIAGPLNPGVG